MNSDPQVQSSSFSNSLEPLPQSSDPASRPVAVSRQYVCSLCDKRFKKKDQLRRHVFTHTNERPYSCLYCPRAFGTSSHVRRHVRRVHKTDPPPIMKNKDYVKSTSIVEDFYCLDKETNQTDKFPPMPEECTVYGRFDAEESDEEERVLAETNGVAKKQNLCPICSKDCSLTPQQRLSQPRILRVGIVSTADLTESCKENDDLMSHIRVEHLSDWNFVTASSQRDTTYFNLVGKCRIPCKMLSRHSVKSLSSGKKVVTSQVQESASVRLQPSHLKVAIGEKPRVVSTTFIPDHKEQDTLCDLDEWILAPDQAMPLQFPTHLFSDINSLSRPLTCRKCFKTSDSHGFLNSKHSKVQSKPDIEGNQSDLTCADCEKSLKYRCAECGKGFECPSSLQRHFRAHTGEKPFECSYCEVNFTERGSMNKHVRKKHASEVAMESVDDIDAYIRNLPSQRRVEEKSSNSLPKEKMTQESYYKCYKCLKVFYSLESMQDHIIQCLTGELATERGKSCKCSRCGKGFEGMFRLFGHMRVHAKSALIDSIPHNPRDSTLPDLKTEVASQKSSSKETIGSSCFCARIRLIDSHLKKNQ